MKKLNKFTLLFVFIVVSAWLFIFRLDPVTKHNQEHNHYKIPPEGWTISTNQFGFYGCSYPGSTYVISTAIGGLHMRSKQEALDRAWLQYDFEINFAREASKKPNQDPAPHWSTISN